MPEISGHEATERMRQIRPSLKALYMSEYAGDAIVHHGALGAGIPFIQKPFSAEALARKVREVLDS